MPDGFQVNLRTTDGDQFASDLIGGFHYQREKITFGVDGVATDVSSSAPLPVTFALGATEATLSSLNGKVTAVNTGAVVIASGSLTSITSPVAVTSATFATTAKQDLLLAQLSDFSSLSGTDSIRINGSNSDPVVVQHNGSINVGNISGTVNLPTGAATAARQDTLAALFPAALVGGRLDVNVGASTALTVSGTVAVTGVATETTLAALNAKVTACNTNGVVISSGTLTGISNAVSITGTLTGITNSVAVTGTFYPATQTVDGTVNVSGVATETTLGGVLKSSEFLDFESGPGTKAVAVAALGGGDLQVNCVNAITAANLKVQAFGALADNASNPSTKLGVLASVSSASVFSLTEGRVNPLRTKLDGDLVVTLDSEPVAVTGTFWQVTQPISGTVDVGSLPTLASVTTVGTVSTVTAITNVVHVDDNFGSLTVDGSVSTKDEVEAMIVDEASASVTYQGWAAAGTATSAASWKVRKIGISGTVTSITWADGNGTYDNVWNNRASLSYS